jgi:hypothetical protein
MYVCMYVCMYVQAHYQHVLPASLVTITHLRGFEISED